MRTKRGTTTRLDAPPEITTSESVDLALRVAARRDTFPRGEAIELLRQAVAGIRDQLHAAQATAILDDTAAAYGGDETVARSRIIDPLLDMRLVLGNVPQSA
jgi:hypothetical protein